MGLDITAYSKVRFVHDESEQTDACWDELDHIHVANEPVFLPRQDSLRTGCYVSDGTDRHFRAGSYGGYNEWRERLCAFALQTEPKVVWAAPEDYAGQP